MTHEELTEIRNFLANRPTDWHHRPVPWVRKLWSHAEALCVEHLRMLQTQHERHLVPKKRER